MQVILISDFLHWFRLVPGRVLYDYQTWILIQKFFDYPVTNKFRKINVLTRARLVSDMFALAEGRLLEYEIVLGTMKYLSNEEDLLPWMVALKEFDLIRSRLLGSDTSLLERYQVYLSKICFHFWAILKWRGWSKVDIFEKSSSWEKFYLGLTI